MSIIITTKIFIDRSNIIHKNKFDYSKVDYISHDIKIDIICPIHGSFFMMPVTHLQGQGCKPCGVLQRANKRRKPINHFINDANIIHNNKYCYDKVNYINNRTKIEIICKKHGCFSQTPKDHIINKAGCPLCKNEQTSQKFTMTFDEFVKKSRQAHGDLYEYDSVYFTNAMTKAKIVCKKHGEFWQSPNSHYFGQGCQKCTHIVSHMETKWLDSLDVPKDQRNTKLPKLGRLSVDGWKSDEFGNIFVYEFNGSFWHGDSRLYDQNKWNNVTKCSFGHLYNKTLKKAKTIEDAGYKLITMWEKDWVEKCSSERSPLATLASEIL